MNQRLPARSWQSSPTEIPRLPGIVGLEQLTRDWAWGGSTGHGVRVGVIDSGIENSHPAIDGHVSGFVSFSEDGSGQLRAVEEPHGDDFGHGTACAGIIRSY